MAGVREARDSSVDSFLQEGTGDSSLRIREVALEAGLS
jgi:hypothetical protein